MLMFLLFVALFPVLALEAAELLLGLESLEPAPAVAESVSYSDILGV